MRKLPAAPSPSDPSLQGPASPNGDNVVVGRIKGPQGLRGELRVELLSDVATRFSPGSVLYPITKRLQEEMCRSFHDAHGSRIIVLRPDYIVDSRIGLGRHRETLGPPDHPARNGWVCRHDLAEACRLAVESEEIDFDIFHIVGTPEADQTCNVARSREVLGLTYRGDLEQYRAP